MRMSQRNALRVSFRGLMFVVILSSVSVLVVRVSHASAVDPGPRGGPPGAGGPVSGLSSSESQLFMDGQETIQEIDSVQGTIPNTGLGLGPRYNMDGCSGCHNFPAPGGSSPPVNPLVAVATEDGAMNVVPFFIAIDGPILRAFIIGNTGSQETHLYTITGRSDAPGCNIAQPDFNSLAPDLAFHMPLPLYGDGLVEAVDTSTIVANLASNLALKRSLGISGKPSGTGGVGRFFWKGQGTGLEGIAAGAYQNEVGVTNSLFPTEDDPDPNCQFNPLPEDTFNPNSGSVVAGLPDFSKIAGFARFSAGPMPIPDTPSIANGRRLFNQVGCALCHTPSLQTGSRSSPALSHQTIALYSDLALHDMGPDLADGISEGNAGPQDFRTPPLWGLGQRIFFLHDGRTQDLVAAISAHSGSSGGSEADAVIAAFNALTDQQKQAVLNFLRAL